MMGTTYKYCLLPNIDSLFLSSSHHQILFLSSKFNSICTMKLTTVSILVAASSALAVPTNVKRDSYIQISDFWARAAAASPGASMHFVVTDPNYPEDTPTECNLIW
jgi:hypothetical protein